MAIAATLGLLMMNALQPGNRLDDGDLGALIQEYSGQAQQHVRDQRHAAAVHAGPPWWTCSCSHLFGAFVGNQRNALGDVLPLILFANPGRAAASSCRASAGPGSRNRLRRQRAHDRASCTSP